MLVKGKAPQVLTAAARQEPVANIPETPEKARHQARKGKGDGGLLPPRYPSPGVSRAC